MLLKTVLILAIFLGMLVRCSGKGNSNLSGSGPPVQQQDDQVFIVDQTGKAWDVTHARDRYQMEPELFQYGLGPFAITPVLDPVMLSPGDSLYPAAEETFLVIGVNLFNNARAYPLGLLRCHEVANELFGNAHVAVAY